MKLDQQKIDQAVETPDGRKEILSECHASLGVFAEVMLPERFHIPFTALHEQMLEVFDDESLRRVVIAAPRGLGKSSLVLAKMARNIVFREDRFICWVSKSATHAEMWTENLKTELLASKRLKRFGFGSMKTKKVADMEQSFSKKSWTASYPGEDQFQTLVLPRGAGQQLRGLSFGPFRPSLIIFDDLEDDELIENEENRKKNKRWFLGSASEAIPQFEGAKWRLIYIDTVKHEDALICDLLESDRWENIQLSICDSTYVSLAPGFMNTEQIKEKVDYYREQGSLDVFAREFMCEPIAKEDAIFKADMFKYYEEADAAFIDRKPFIKSLVIVDPAKTAKMHSAQSGIVCWGIDVETNAFYLRYAVGEKLYPDELYGRAFEIAELFSASIIGVESTGLGEFIMHPFRNEAIRRGKHFQLIDLKAKRGQGEFSGLGGGKKGRIASLVPFYRQGLVWHNRGGATIAYEMQLLSFPRSKRWDIMDAAGYLPELLDEMTMYFMPKSEVNNPYSIAGEYDDILLSDFKDSDFHDDFKVI